MLSLKVNNEIELRAYEERDAEALFALVSDNYEHLRPFLHWVTPDYSLEISKEFIASNQRSVIERKSAAYGIFRRGELVGSVGFVKFNWDSRSTEIGYFIAAGFQRRGIITKSCRALINYAFGELEMKRIEIRCATENTRSRAIPERLGFQLEGVLRQSLWRHDRFYDMAIYGLLAEEWRKQAWSE